MKAMNKTMVGMAVLAVISLMAYVGQSEDRAAAAGKPKLQQESPQVRSSNGNEAARLLALPDFRRITLPITGHQLLFVKEGSFVDMVVTMDVVTSKGGSELTSATILQNILVTGVVKPTKLDDTGAVQLLLSPLEAQFAALSVTQGRAVYLTLRREGDVEKHFIEMASFRKLFK